MVAVCASPTIGRMRNWPSSRLLLASALALWAIGPWLMPDSLYPGSQHNARFLNLLVPLLLLPVAFLVASGADWFNRLRPHLVKFSAALLLVQSLWHISATAQWQGFVGVWQATLTSHSGPVKWNATPFARNSMGGQALRFDWFWANPCLSIALAPEGQVRTLILASSPPVWQPFDPLDANGLPKLERYGIDYSRYLAALSAASKPALTKQE